MAWLPEKIHVHDRGGTDFRPVFELMEDRQRPSCLLFMTDCCGDYPSEQPIYPVLWVDTRDPSYSSLGGNYDPPFGEHIKMKPGVTT